MNEDEGELGSAHVFSEIFLHVNWHCLNNRPMIVETVEPVLYKFLEEYCAKTKGIHFKGVGGTRDHIHLIFQLEPFVKISKFVGNIKGASSFDMNRRFRRGTIRWQRGYGVVSFAHQHLPGVQLYVAKQKEHHAADTTKEVLERFDTEDEVESRTTSRH